MPRRDKSKNQKRGDEARLQEAPIHISDLREDPGGSPPVLSNQHEETQTSAGTQLQPAANFVPDLRLGKDAQDAPPNAVIVEEPEDTQTPADTELQPAPSCVPDLRPKDTLQNALPDAALLNEPEQMQMPANTGEIYSAPTSRGIPDLRPPRVGTSTPVVDNEPQGTQTLSSAGTIASRLTPAPMNVSDKPRKSAKRVLEYDTE